MSVALSPDDQDAFETGVLESQAALLDAVDSVDIAEAQATDPENQRQILAADDGDDARMV